jgi:hypothetical protein
MSATDIGAASMAELLVLDVTSLVVDGVSLTSFETPTPERGVVVAATSDDVLVAPLVVLVALSLDPESSLRQPPRRPTSSAIAAITMDAENEKRLDGSGMAGDFLPLRGRGRTSGIAPLIVRGSA